MRSLPLSTLAVALLASIATAQPVSIGPSAEPVVRFRATGGVDRGFSGLVSGWEDSDGLTVGQDYGAWMPEWRAHDISGRPALHFDGDDSLTRADGMPSGDYTKVVVITIDDYGWQNNVLSGASEHALFFNYSDRARLYHTGTFVVSSQPTPLGEPTVIVGTYNATTGEGNLYQNGRWVGSGFAPPHADPAIQVGSFASGSNFQGSIAEAMVYDRVLTDTERRLLERSLIGRYRGAPVPDLILTEWPADGAVVARDAADRADVHASGVVRALGRPTIELRVYRDGLLVDTRSQALGDPWDYSSFDLSTTLDAGLHEYDFELSLRDGPARVVIGEARSVVCGDLYIVSGQSNAVAADYHSEGRANQSQSPWIRSYGTAATGPEVRFDHHWDIADGLLYHGHAAIGAWALRAAELLVERHGVPIGMVNGAVSGTTVGQHQRNDANPEDLSTIYGRLLHRSRAAGISGQYRAVVWHQGESDGENAPGWEAGFAALRDDWAEDYPGLERLFLFQIRKGCGFQYAGVRESQRRLADDPEVSVMSTTAVPTHDGCHFWYAGYRTMGERLGRLIDRDLLGSGSAQEIDPPNIDRAEWTDPGRTAVRLTFRDPDDTLVWEAGSAAYFLLSDGTAVVSGEVSGNTITLQLAGVSSAATVSYDGHSYDGPWVRNGSGVGALTFFDVPIE